MTALCINCASKSYIAATVDLASFPLELILDWMSVGGRDMDMLRALKQKYVFTGLKNFKDKDSAVS